MIDYVGKVKLNYTFYNGKDDYSDGDIEDDLLELVSKENNINTILENDYRWPILYHLSPVRQNIIEWYPFKKNATVLEIGSGCGAITGAISKKVSKVTCVELSKRRSLINANRNNTCDNVEIFVGNYNDIALEEKYDYITLIGVLEYADYYTDGNNSYIDFLKNVKKYLKEDGKLLVAIENKYGIKYWAGAKEDHTGVFFDGIIGYNGSDLKVRTFSKKELAQIMKDAGFDSSYFYYPYPDYKFPVQIFSDDYLPNVADINAHSVSYDKRRANFFSEKEALVNLISEQMFDFYSNSFFVEASINKNGEEDRKIFSKFTKERNEEFQIETYITLIDGKKHILKKSLKDSGNMHISNMHDYYVQNPIGLCASHMIDNSSIEFDYHSGKSLYEEIVEAAEKKDRNAFFDFLRIYKRIVKDMCAREKTNVDLSLDNIINTNGGYLVIDYEWVSEKKLSEKYVAYRGIYAFYIKNNDCFKSIASFEELLDFFEITKEDREQYAEIDGNFYNKVFGHLDYEKQYRMDEINVNTVLNQLPIMQLFFDCGEGFSEEKSSFEIIPRKNVIYSMKVESNVSLIRIDPIDRPGVIKNIVISLFDKDGNEYICNEYTTNGIKDSERMTFYCLDPQIVLENKLEDRINSIKVSYDIITCELNDMYDKLMQENQKLEEKLNEVFLGKLQKKL